MSALDGKTFVLGVGAQKAGTTWLQSYLNPRPEVFLSPLKEMHYLEAKYLPGRRAPIEKYFKRKERILFRQQIWPSARRRERLEHIRARLAMADSNEAYFAYFEKYVPAGATHFGEITPEYSLLPRAAFEDLGRRFENMKLVLLLRDPVDRYFSHLRMDWRAGRLKGESEQALFLRLLDDDTYLRNSYYHDTVATIRSVLDERQLFIGFYEDLFNDAEITRLCDFLGLRFLPGAYDVRVNAAAKPATIAPEMASLAREKFAPVYDFCQAEFGARLPASWRV
ncbi:conserved hypothetical protein [Parvibaculum lavamentivorans DS-1]|uniref:Sulfotransferase n=1 Tax=Parvibaculum lavamentivorans (strain DS-1 / DSM 13023 / NCIMB 13966) TaxID=402881 RepID=A7HSR9_PARL1|nr:sulfotransferase [Parvibaculum lavamentivorans]ABS62952.1 conserved hypothetical protein [Parvibaculum lavamentivorans DS-1]